MSDTPETNANTYWNALPKLATSAEIVNANLARKLERERNALANRLKRAEEILSRLADGYPVSVLDDATPGEQMGQWVLEYWREIEKREGGADHG